MNRILVMDNMATMLVLTKRALMSAGFPTDAVQTWEKAKAFLPTAAIFIVGWDDYDMPAEQGDNIVYAAKLERPNLPVFLHTWEPGEKMKDIVKRLGADGVITNKGDAVSLIRQVRALMD